MSNASRRLERNSFIPFRPTLQDILVDEYFATCEVDLLDTEIGGGFEVWYQFGTGDLLKAIVGRR
jgi:hypothetical protein